jgi:hypothetical protein
VKRRERLMAKKYFTLVAVLVLSIGMNAQQFDRGGEVVTEELNQVQINDDGSGALQVTPPNYIGNSTFVWPPGACLLGCEVLPPADNSVPFQSAVGGQTQSINSAGDGSPNGVHPYAGAGGSWGGIPSGAGRYGAAGPQGDWRDTINAGAQSFVNTVNWTSNTIGSVYAWLNQLGTPKGWILVGDTVRRADSSSGPLTTYLYEKVGPNGEHLKYGISDNPATRYTQAELRGGRLKILAQGERGEMLQLERSLHENLPIGPEEGQSFYIDMQVEKGLMPPPYEVLPE